VAKKQVPEIFLMYHLRSPPAISTNRFKVPAFFRLSGDKNRKWGEHGRVKALANGYSVDVEAIDPAHLAVRKTFQPNRLPIKT